MLGVLKKMSKIICKSSSSAFNGTKGALILYRMWDNRSSKPSWIDKKPSDTKTWWHIPNCKLVFLCGSQIRGRSWDGVASKNSAIKSFFRLFFLDSQLLLSFPLISLELKQNSAFSGISQFCFKSFSALSQLSRCFSAIQEWFQLNSYLNSSKSQLFFFQISNFSIPSWIFLSFSQLSHLYLIFLAAFCFIFVSVLRIIHCIQLESAFVRFLLPHLSYIEAYSRENWEIKSWDRHLLKTYSLLSWIYFFYLFKPFYCVWMKGSDVIRKMEYFQR